MPDGKVSDWLEEDSDAEPAERAEPESGGSVRDRPSTLMYLPPELTEELEVLKARLKAAARRDGRTLSVNRDIYPALIRTALDHVDEVRNYLDMKADT